MKNSNDTIGNQTQDLPICSAMPQPAAPRRIPTLSAPEIILPTFLYHFPSAITVLSEQISVYFVNPHDIYLCTLSLYLFIHLTP